MKLTKTKTRIMELFCSKIRESFSIRQAGIKLGIDYSLIHRTIIPMIKEERLLSIDKHGLISLNIRENHDILTFIEYIRRNRFFRENKDLDKLLSEFIDKYSEDCFITIVFGSAVYSKKPNDIDILLISDNYEKAEKELFNKARDFGLADKIHIVSIPYNSTYEMLGKRDEINIINELLDNHIMINGAETFYRILNKARR